MLGFSAGLFGGHVCLLHRVRPTEPAELVLRAQAPKRGQRTHQEAGRRNQNHEGSAHRIQLAEVSTRDLSIKSCGMKGAIMLLTGYKMEILRPECNSSFQSVHCIAHLDQDISEVLPYLNADLGGFSYVVDPPSVTFKSHGKLITVYADRIAMNALEDQAEARKVLEWLKSEINRCWKNRQNIRPSTKVQSSPQIITILKHLPLTNCADCGQATCMVFASLIAQGAKEPSACPHLEPAKHKELESYLLENSG